MAPAESEFDTFRPRQVRIISVVSGIILPIGFAVLSVALLIVDWQAWTLMDMIWMNLLGVASGAAMWRLSDIQARPDESGLTVKNMVRTKSFRWSQILGVSFSPDGDDPWPILDLIDGTSYPVMAIQHADGPRAHADCARLRKLIDKWTHIQED